MFFFSDPSFLTFRLIFHEVKQKPPRKQPAKHLSHDCESLSHDLESLSRIRFDFSGSTFVLISVYVFVFDFVWISFVVFLFRFLFTSFWFRFSEFFWVQFLWIFLTPLKWEHSNNLQSCDGVIGLNDLWSCLISKGLSNLSHSLSLSVSSILSIAVVEHSEKEGIFMQNRIVRLSTEWCNAITVSS